MNLFEIVVLAFLLGMVVLTFITEPKLSIQYFKACGESIAKIVHWVKDIVSDMREKGTETENYINK